MQYVERAKIESFAGGHRHQGVLAYVAPVPYAELDDILKAAEAKGEAPFLVLLDELEDPHNLGALLRPLVLVVGSEGRGMSRLTKEACDFIVSMPMVGRINSLNASVAGSILMYESMRQRLQKKG